MARYRPRHEDIDAFQWGGRLQDLSASNVPHTKTREGGLAVILDGGTWKRLFVGDWVCRSAGGTLFTLSASDFERAYQLGD